MNNLLKNIWGGDKSAGFKIAAWAAAIVAWQVVDSDSWLREKYNTYRFQESLKKSEESLKNSNEEQKHKLLAEIDKMKTER